MRSFRRFHPAQANWGEEFSLDDLISLYLGGHVAPDDQLWCSTGTTTVSEQIVLATAPLPGWTVNLFERRAASVPWRIASFAHPAPWLSGPHTLDDLREMHRNGQIALATYVTLGAAEANCIPLAWLLCLPAPAPPPKPKDDVPWGKIALGAVALFGLAWTVKRATEDPEPRAIKRIAEEKEAEGALVFADVRGFPRPPIMNGRIADVVAYHEDGTIEAVEVENDRSIDRSHAAGQIEDLAVWASRSPRRTFSVEIVSGGRGGKG